MTTTSTRQAGSYPVLGTSRSDVTARVRGILPWLVILLLGALALIAVGARGSGTDRLLDPRSAGKSGSKAIAEVLRHNGIDVRPVTVPQELPRTAAPGTTVVVTADDRLSPSSVREVLARSAEADRLVVLLAEPGVVPLIEPHLAGVAIDALPSGPAARCAVPQIHSGDVVAGGTVMLLDQGGPHDADLCLPVIALPDGGSLLAHLPATDDRPQTLLIGFARGLTNAAITNEDTAAVALRLLGQSPQVTWLISADASSNGADDTFSPWPAWSTPVAVVLAIGTVLLALIRGRRLGRLVPEPLPVIVRAAETTESRGHLYRRSRDLDRTARILREGTRRRLRRRLGVGRTAPLEDLVIAVAAVTGEPRDRIQSLLADTDPGGSAALVRLGSDLTDLEGKVRRT